MSNDRKDNKGRKLHSGEMQLKTGQYRFKYTDALGKARYCYSWRLTKNDRVPQDKKNCVPLREMEKKIQADLFDNIASNGDNMRVLELVEKYVSTKTTVRRSTKTGYKTVINVLKNDPMGKALISKIRVSDAKCWLIKLQQKDKKSYSSIHTIRGVLRPAFKLAVDDDLIRKNPFDFPLVEVVVNDSVRREAITRDQERKFLKFVKEDEHFSKYYEGFYILFKTGLRISEFCGLTLKDVDISNHVIHVNHQLRYISKTGLYIEDTKSAAGHRDIPMSPDVEECFKTILKRRGIRKIEPCVDGYRGFLYFDSNGKVLYSMHWEKYFRRAVDKYNSIYKVQLPRITPHVCRHTYCSNMANSGMNPKTLQYLMGHSDISVTLNIYTHVNYEDIREEMLRVANLSQIVEV